MYPVVPNTSYPSDRTRPWKRWSNFKPSEWDGCQQNKQHGSCYIALIYPVVPNTSYPSERTWPGWGGAILSRVRWLSTEQTNNMEVATLPSCIRSYQTPVTPVRGLGGEGGGDTFQLIVTVQQRLCLIPFGPFFTVDAACRTNLSMSVKTQSHL